MSKGWYRVEINLGSGWFTDCDFENEAHAKMYAKSPPMPNKNFMSKVTDVHTGNIVQFHAETGGPHNNDEFSAFWQDVNRQQLQ